MTTTQFLWLINAFMAGMGFTMLLDIIADRGYPARAMAWCRERSWVKRLGALAAVAVLGVLLHSCAAADTKQGERHTSPTCFFALEHYLPGVQRELCRAEQEKRDGKRLLEQAAQQVIGALLWVMPAGDALAHSGDENPNTVLHHNHSRCADTPFAHQHCFRDSGRNSCHIHGGGVFGATEVPCPSRPDDSPRGAIVVGAAVVGGALFLTQVGIPAFATVDNKDGAQGYRAGINWDRFTFSVNGGDQGVSGFGVQWTYKFGGVE